MRVPNLDELKQFVHPSFARSLLQEGVGDRDTLRERMRQGRWTKIMEAKIRDCDTAIGQPIPDLPRSLYDDFARTGRRAAFECPYFQRRTRAEDLAMSYLLTGEAKYLDRCRDYIWAIMEEFTWVLPAHTGGRSFSPDTITLVDLFSSGTALCLADLWDILHEDLDPETLNWMRRCVLRQVLVPLRDHYDEQVWAHRPESNWCGVCCGNSGTALVLMALDEPWTLELLHKMLESILPFLSTADRDGAWVEGVEYWFYGFSRVVYLSDVLFKVTNGEIDLLAHPSMRATSRFPIYAYLPPDACVNFGDTSVVPCIYPDVMAKFADRYQDPAIKWYIEQVEEQGLLRGGTLRDLLWPMPEKLNAAPPNPSDISKHYRDIGVIVTRSSWTDLDAPVLALKAGHNAEPHNHNDIGQFLVHCYGETYICDTGIGVYDRAYFGPERYDNPVCGAEGHNLIFVDGKGQQAGKEYRGRIVEHRQAGNWERVIIDMTHAYPPDVLSNAQRTLYFLKPEGWVLKDEVTCREGAEVESRLHVAGKVTLLKDGAIVSGEAGSVLITCAEPGVDRILIGVHENLRLGHAYYDPSRMPLPVPREYLRFLTTVRTGGSKIVLYIIPYRTEREQKTRRTALAKFDHPIFS